MKILSSRRESKTNVSKFYKLIAILRRQYRIILAASWEKIYSRIGRSRVLYRNPAITWINKTVNKFHQKSKISILFYFYRLNPVLKMSLKNKKDSPPLYAPQAMSSKLPSLHRSGVFRLLHFPT